MHRRRLTLLAVLLGLIGVAPAAPASAADESWTIPHTATIIVDGHGYGHGRGMSQYGAQHAAAAGAGYRSIVDYYYPGTSWGTAAGSVRIWITRDLTNDVQVAARAGLRAQRVGGGKAWNLTRVNKLAKRWRINPVGDRVSVLQYRTRGWHTYRKVRGSLQFAAAGKPIRLYVHGGSVAYRGILRSVPSPSTRGNRLTINIVPMETYLRGVVPRETIASAWKQQALRAQAVAARSYAAYQRLTHRTKVYDLCETESCQVYGGATAEYPTTDAAVRATARRILTYRGRPAFTEFSASSGGWTTRGDAPYLTAMSDRYDTPKDPNHAWRVRFTDRELEKAWPSIGDLRGIEIGGRDGHGEWGGRAGSVTLTGTRDSVALSGTGFAQKLHLRSEWLTFRVS